MVITFCGGFTFFLVFVLRHDKARKCAIFLVLPCSNDLNNAIVFQGSVNKDKRHTLFSGK